VLFLELTLFVHLFDSLAPLAQSCGDLAVLPYPFTRRRHSASTPFTLTIDALLLPDVNVRKTPRVNLFHFLPMLRDANAILQHPAEVERLHAASRHLKLVALSRLVAIITQAKLVVILPITRSSE
jgi:hypothetical protein